MTRWMATKGGARRGSAATARVSGDGATSNEMARLGTREAVILGWKNEGGARVFICHRRGWHGTQVKVGCSPSRTRDATAMALRCINARVCGGAGASNAELGWAEAADMRG
jgi:hypothetical protein